MKKFAQVLGSIVYTYLFSALMYVMMALPLLLFSDVSWKVLFLVVFIGVVQGFVTVVQIYATLPFVWLLRNNAVATYLSVGILIYNTIWYIVHVWKSSLGNGTWMVIFAIIASVLLLEVVVGTIPIMIKCRTGEIND